MTGLVNKLRFAALTAIVLLMGASCVQDASPVVTEPDPESGAPSASFTFERTKFGTEISFDATDSVDPDGTIVSWEWNFGDGESGSGQQLVHSYPSAGAYSVMLTVTDDDGNRGSATASVSLATIAGTLSFQTTSFQTTSLQSTSVQNDNSSTLVPTSTSNSSAGYVLPATDVTHSFSLSDSARSAPFVPGEIIVKFNGSSLSMQTRVPPTLTVQGRVLSQARALPLEGMALYGMGGADAEATLDLIDALNARHDVAYAQPNYLLESFLQPTDKLYEFLWHYPAIELEAAWEITTGSEGVVVAVIDSGMLMEHPDRPRNLLSGYDFVSSLDNSDGDGRDADATDPGPFTLTAYHGSHVIGTVAAAANNDYRDGPGADGIVGVNWQATILPTRALGETGTLTDIMDAMLWSAGESVPGVEDNVNPADVINMSLGGAFPCTDAPAYQDAINRVVAAGASVVVAAGNANVDASGFSPASCDNTIAVGASTQADERAFYSNWGSTVDVMAPGGDLSTDLDGDGVLDGVLSLGKDDSSGDFGFVLQSGTSMATPHVAGVIALMLAVEPSLGPGDVLQILSDTASSYTSVQCNAADPDLALDGSDCGAGRIDAYAALQAAQSFVVPPPEPEPDPGMLSFSPSPLAFGSTSTSEDVTLSNTGSTALDWRLLGFTEQPSNPEALGTAVFTIDTANGSIAAGATEPVNVGLNRSEVSAEGAYEVGFLFDTDGDPASVEASLPVTFVIGPATDVSMTGPVRVWAYLEASSVLSGVQASSGAIEDYRFSVETGSNIVLAWSDENENGEIDGGDLFGSFQNDVLVQPGSEITGVDIVLDLVQDTFEVENALPSGLSVETLEFTQ